MLPPSARRTANSRSRTTARPTSRPDTLAHAISRTSEEPTRKGTTVARAFWRERSCSPRTIASRCRPGVCVASIARATRLTSSSACPIVTPGASRPVIWNRR